jgi:putative colanic acid biosynthesis glycosyltransferase
MTHADEPTPWLSIITVVKDEPEGLARTAESIAMQGAITGAVPGVEWIVIDSSAEALDPAGLAGKCPGVTFRYGWTPPMGVYPAMNAGLEDARGAYVMFLNAGDEFFDSETVASIRRILDRDRPLWMFGQVCFVAEDGSRVTPPPLDYSAERRSSFSRGRFPPHQGTIANRQTLLDLGGFDTSYRIAADYAVFLRLSLRAEPSISDDTIALFHEGGLSTIAWRESLREFHRARREILKPSGLTGAAEWLNSQIGVAKATIYRRMLK